MREPNYYAAGMGRRGSDGGALRPGAGLSGGVWSAGTERALAAARRIRTGTVTINGSPISFDGPFGGYKASGTGREYGAVGLSEYLEHKTVTRRH